MHAFTGVLVRVQLGYGQADNSVPTNPAHNLLVTLTRSGSDPVYTSGSLAHSSGSTSVSLSPNVFGSLGNGNGTNYPTMAEGDAVFPRSAGTVSFSADYSGGTHTGSFSFTDFPYVDPIHFTNVTEFLAADRTQPFTLTMAPTPTTSLMQSANLRIQRMVAPFDTLLNLNLSTGTTEVTIPANLLDESQPYLISGLTGSQTTFSPTGTFNFSASPAATLSLINQTVIVVSPIPEPAVTAALGGAAVLGFALLRRRRNGAA